jgi:hypothetical protein
MTDIVLGLGATVVKAACEVWLEDHATINLNGDARARRFSGAGDPLTGPWDS